MEPSKKGSSKSTITSARKSSPKVTKNKLCKQCGKEFKPYSTLDKFCGPKCGKKAEDAKAKQKRAVEREKKKVSVSALSKKADMLWSRVVRMPGRCEYCGAIDKKLDAHHIYSRSNKSTRWDVSNGICLCAYHHTFGSDFSAHKTPCEFTDWISEYRGKEWYDGLRSRKNAQMKVTSEYLLAKIDEFVNILGRSN